MDLLLYFAVAIAVIVVVFTFAVRLATVFEFEKALLYRRGAFRRVLGPGQYWFMPLFSRIDKLDVRRRFATIGGQEVLTADSVSLKISIAAEYEVADTQRASHVTQTVDEALYLTLQVALRSIIGATTADDLLGQRQQLSAQLTEAARSKAKDLGLTLHDAALKDIMFPGDLKKVFAQVVRARKEAAAALEKARGETAALRHLSNASKLLENNPSLIVLRTLQSLDDSSGNSVVLAPAELAAAVRGKNEE